MEDGSGAAVAISLSVPRKGTAKLLPFRAPLDVWLYQMIEDVEALLLSSTAALGVVGNGGLVRLPTARVSVLATKGRRKRLLGFLRVFIRCSTVVVESVVSHGGRDVALFIALASPRASTEAKTKTKTFLTSLSTRRVTGWCWATVWSWAWAA